MPGLQRAERADGERMISPGDDDSWIRAVRDLDHRPVEARRIVDRCALREAHGHSLGEESPVVRPRYERAPEAAHDAVAAGNRVEDVL